MVIMRIYALFSTRRKKEIRKALKRGDFRVFYKAERESSRKKADQMRDVLMELRRLERKLGLEAIKKIADSLENDPTDETDANAINALLIASAIGNDLEGVQKALSYGADMNADAAPFEQTDDNGGICKTAIQVARTKGHIGISMYLAQRGGRNLPDNRPRLSVAEANALLRRAAATADLDAVKDAIGKGADVNAQDEKGRSSLMFASFHGHAEIVSLLIENNADVDARAEHDVTALMLASSQGRIHIVELLIENNADVNAPNKDSATALDYASHEGHAEVVELLKRHGAERRYP